MSALPRQHGNGTAHIVTGPPGAGKLRWVYENHRSLPIYGCYFYNKKHWRGADNQKDIALLCYSAPAQAKQYWVDEVQKEGWTPRLYVQHSTYIGAMDRMRSRPHSNDLIKEVEWWFKNYTYHSDQEDLPILPNDAMYEAKIYDNRVLTTSEYGGSPTGEFSLLP